MKPHLSVLLAFMAMFAANSTGSEYACPFLPSDENKETLSRTADALDKLRQACKPNAKLDEQFSNLNKLVLDVNSKARTDISVPENVVGSNKGVVVTCSSYTAAIAHQRRDALRRLEYQMQPPEDAAYAACFRDKSVDCIHNVANDRVAETSRYCNSRRTYEQGVQLQNALNEGFRSVDTAVEQIFQNMSQDCSDFPNQQAQIANAAIQLTSSLAATFAVVQPMPQAAGLGIVMGANLLKHASNFIFSREDKVIRQFKRQSQFPAKACLLYELQQKQIGCDHLLAPPPDKIASTPSLTRHEKNVVRGTAQNGVDDLLDAMKATDEATKAQAGAQDFIPALDALSNILDSDIANPAYTPGGPGKAFGPQRLPVTDYLEKVATDLKRAAENPNLGKEERGALVRMSSNVSQLLVDYAKYQNSSPASPAQAEAKTKLLKQLKAYPSPSGTQSCMQLTQRQDFEKLSTSTGNCFYLRLVV